MKKNMTNEERKNKRKMNASLAIVWGLGLFTAHTITKLHYKQKLNDLEYNSEKIEHFLFGEREKDIETIGVLRRENICLRSQLKDHERNEKLRKDWRDWERKLKTTFSKKFEKM